MKRKVVLHGPTTLTVSLPMRWVKRHHVKKGQEIDVEDAGDMLLIRPSGAVPPPKTTQADLTGMGKLTVNRITSILYRLGYDEISLKYSGSSFQTIHDLVSSTLIGYEIMSQDETHCVIKSISASESGEFNNVLRRVFLVTISMAERCISVLSDKEKNETIGDVLLLEKTNNRLTTYCQRILNKESFANERTTFFYLLLWLLESICDEFKHILHFVENGRISVDAKFLDYFSTCAVLLNDFYKLYYTYDLKTSDTLRVRTETLCDELHKVMSTQPNHPVLYAFLFNTCRFIQDMLTALVGIKE